MAATNLCPKCSGKLVPVGERTGGFSAGKAVVGAVVAGPVGVAAGALGKKLITLQCEKCGYTVETDEKSAVAAQRFGEVSAPIEALKNEVLKQSVSVRFSQRVAEKVKAFEAKGIMCVPFKEIQENSEAGIQFAMERELDKLFASAWPDELKGLAQLGKYEELDLDEQERLAHMSMEEMVQRARENYLTVCNATGGATEERISCLEKILACLSYEPVTENLILYLTQFPLVYLAELLMDVFGDAIQRVPVCAVTIVPEWKAAGLPAEQALEFVGYRLAGGPKELQRIQEIRQAEEAEREAQRLAQQSREWEAQGLCRYCGGALAKGFFSKKCTSCGKKN